MKPELLVVRSQRLDLVPGIVQEEDTGLVQALGPEPAVESLDKRIVRRLSGLFQNLPHSKGHRDR